MIVDNIFEIGETVYIKTDNEQKPRVITGLIIRPAGHIVYYCGCGVDESCHYAIELSKDENILTKIS